MEEKISKIDEREEDQKEMAETFSAVKNENPQKAKELFAFMKGLLSGYDIGIGNTPDVKYKF